MYNVPMVRMVRLGAIAYPLRPFYLLSMSEVYNLFLA